MLSSHFLTYLSIWKGKVSLKRNGFAIHKVKTKCQRCKRHSISSRGNPGTVWIVWNSIIDIEIYVWDYRNGKVFFISSTKIFFFRNWVPTFLVNSYLYSCMVKHWCISPFTKISSLWCRNSMHLSNT